jgi:hypothetical protein
VKHNRLVVALLALALTACGTPDDSSSSEKTVDRPLFQDQRLRPVRMTSGRALGYVQPETASQVLCQLLDKADWEELLGGDIGRKPLDAPYAGCQIATELGMVSMRLLNRDTAFEAKTTTAGRPSIVDEEAVGGPMITVALSDDALQQAPRQSYPARRLLEVQLIGHDVAFGSHVLDKIVPMLVEEKETLPDIDGQGHVRYVSTPLAKVDEFVDLPQPVQALQLCTALQENLKVATTRSDPNDTGKCALSTAAGPVSVAAMHVNKPKDYPKRVADRPASVDSDVVTVLLRDDADVELFVSAPNSMALAEKLVPLLIS